MILDTTFLIDVMNRNPEAHGLARRLESEGSEMSIPAPALYELSRGVFLTVRPEQEALRIRQLLGRFHVIPFDAVAAERAGEVDARLLRAGVPLDPEDTMIVGTALAARESLVTRNARPFARIPELTVVGY